MSFLENRYINTWTEHTEQSMERAKQMTLVERLFKFVHIISYKWEDGKLKKFLKIARTTLKFTLFHEFLGGLYATLIWNKLDVL